MRFNRYSVSTLHFVGRITPQIVAGLLAILFFASSAKGQDEKRFYRIWLVDKGTPDRVLSPNDPWYSAATAHLTERALRRRAHVLPLDSLVSTADLPIFEEYRTAIIVQGADIAQTSRWLNTVMIFADSATFEKVKNLPFVASATVVRTVRRGEDVPVGKPVIANADDQTTGIDGSCITNLYGLADRQNRAVRFDAAHQTGFAGEGVLIGILDAGFDWRNHNSLKNAHVIAERDFVNNDDNAADEPDQFPSESHGTLVMSIIGGWYPGMLIGGAPRAEFALAKTENVNGEKNVEEDNFVAGLEWLEALGADIATASLGYTTFDDPENDHSYAELDGKTAIASRGINYATRLGILCTVAAGNEYSSFRYVSVPAEADSAIAVAALDTAGNVASFSSRGFGPQGESGIVRRLKPDVAAPGVRVYGAVAGDPDGFVAQQGTSLATPIVAAAAAVILSAHPGLRPWEMRNLFYETSSRATNPDTAVGHGTIDVNRALSRLSRDGILVGMPKLLAHDGSLSAVAWIVGDETPEITSWKESAEQGNLMLTLRNLRTGSTLKNNTPRPINGLARWLFPAGVEALNMLPGDSIEMVIALSTNESTLRRSVLQATDGLAVPVSTLCKDAPLPVTALAVARPNPFHEGTRIEFSLDKNAVVSLDIFNVLGEQVRQLLSAQETDPGFHSILLNPVGLSGGAYYYRLKVNDAVYSEKMIYLK